MPSILLPTTFTDPDLDTSTDLKTQILANASLIQWLQTDAVYGSISSGRIASLTDLKAGAVWTASVGGSGFALTAEASYGGFTAATGTAGTDRSIVAPAALDFSGSWSVVMYVRRGATPVAANGNFFSQTGTGNETILCQSTNDANVQLFHKGSGINIPVGSNAPDTNPFLFVASFNGTTLKGSIANGTPVTATPGGGVATSTVTRIGRGYAANFMTGDWSDFMFFNTALHEAANAELLQLVLDYFEGTY